MNRASIAALLLAACGADDPCPTDDCTLYAHTVVKWTFDAYPDRGFAMDSCVDFGAQKVAVDVVDSTGAVTSLVDDCGIAQVTFIKLAPGDYDVFVMPLDVDGVPLLSAPAQSRVSVGNDDVDVTVNVLAEQWLGYHTGTFLFRLSWGGMSCDQAMPEIRQQVLTLTVNGVVQTITTDDGQMLNGSDKKPCKKLTDEFPQSALAVPFGHATLLVEGYDATDMMQFSKQFDTFVGAGFVNPTLTFDVPLN